MMVAHDEFVARERIQRILKRGGLRDREVAGVGHAVELALQQGLPRRLAQERERLSQYEGEWRRQQRAVHTDDRRRRIFLDAEQRSDACFGRHAILDRLIAEEQARARERAVQWPARQGDALPLAVDQQSEILEQRGAPGRTRSIDAEDLWLIASQRSAQR